MTNPFIMGLKPKVADMALLDTKTLYDRVGQNTGNLAFHAAIDAHLGGGLSTIAWGANPQRIDETGSVGVLPAANQFGAHVDYKILSENFAKLECRMVMIGLGAQSDVDGKMPEVPEGTVAWVRQIADHRRGDGPNISVRGPFSKQVLDHYGLGDHAVVLGCPSLFLNPDPELGARIAARVRPVKRVAVAAGLRHSVQLRQIEQSLARLVTVTGGSYVGSHPLPMIQLTRGEARDVAPDELEAHRNYICPEMDTDEFVRWTERHGNVFFDIPNWMEHYRRFDFVIGPRIHGTMLALQAGVPAVCIAHDSRTLELCQTMLVPHILAKDIASGVSRDQLLDLFAQFDATAFDANRRMLARRYVDFLTFNGLAPVSWLRNIAAN